MTSTGAVRPPESPFTRTDHGRPLRWIVISCEPARNTLFGYHPKPEERGSPCPSATSSSPATRRRTSPAPTFAMQAVKSVTSRVPPAGHGRSGRRNLRRRLVRSPGGRTQHADVGQTGAIPNRAQGGQTFRPQVRPLHHKRTNCRLTTSPSVRELGRARLEQREKSQFPQLRLLDDPNRLSGPATWLLAKLGRRPGNRRVPPQAQGSQAHCAFRAFGTRTTGFSSMRRNWPVTPPSCP